MSRYYRLDKNHNVVSCTFEEFAMQYANPRNSDRRIAYTQMNNKTIIVSTVFLALDHSFMPGGPPVVFETMIFGGDDEIDQYQDRYCTWEDAHAGHRKAVRIVRAWMDKQNIKIKKSKTKQL